MKNIHKIMKLFNNYISLNKIKEGLKSEKLNNNLLLEELQDKIKENKIQNEEKIDLLENAQQKQIIALKKNQKKFSEMQNKLETLINKIPMYKNMYPNFQIISFIMDNDNLIKEKKKLYAEVLKSNNQLKLVQAEYDKERNELINNNNYLLLKQEEIKNKELMIENAKNIYKNIKYGGCDKTIIILKKNDNKEDEDINKSIIVNNDFSKGNVIQGDSMIINDGMNYSKYLHIQMDKLFDFGESSDKNE